MNSQNRSNVSWLVITLIMLSASFGILHGRKHKEPHKRPLAVDATPEEVRNYIEFLLLANNFDEAGSLLAHLSLETAYTVLEQLISQEKSVPVTDEEKVTTILAVAARKEADQTHTLFELFKQLPPQTPLFAIAHASVYKDILIQLVDWTINPEFVLPDLHSTWKQASLQHSITEDRLKTLQALSDYPTLRPSSDVATDLLMLTIQKGRNPAFISFLIQELGADSNATRNNQTPLISAVLHKNIDLVKALLDQGANPLKMLDPAAGTAAQIAFDKNYTQIEQLLREYEKRFLLPHGNPLR